MTREENRVAELEYAGNSKFLARKRLQVRFLPRFLRIIKSKSGEGTLKTQTLSILLIGFVLSGLSADEKTLTPTPDAISQKTVGPQQPVKIVLPVVPVLNEDQVPPEDHPAPPPKPNVGPVPVTKLSDDTWYVIESPVKLIILHSPSGHVQVDPDEGPVKIRGKFADGTGKNEVRTYSSKFVYSVSAIKAGQIELLIFPVGVQQESEVLRQSLTIMGLEPNPPPKPDPPKPDPGPKPDPRPMPDPPSESILIEVIEDPMARTVDTSMVLEALVGWSALKDAGHDWRLYSIRSPEPLALEAIALAKEQNVPPPALIVRDKATRKPIRTLNLPKTFADFKRVLSELTGGIP